MDGRVSEIKVNLTAALMGIANAMNIGSTS